MRLLVPTILAAALTLSVGCVTNCTTIAIASVNVTVTDPSGVHIPEAEVFYLPTDADWTDHEACEASPDGETWICGWEVAGEIEIEVSADGYETQVETVFVDEDECHVIQELVDVELEPSS